MDKVTGGSEPKEVFFSSVSDNFKSYWLWEKQLHFTLGF